MTEAVTFFRAALIVDADRDNVAVCKQSLTAGTELTFPDRPGLIVSLDVPRGTRLAIADIPSGAEVLQYGQPFAVSRGIRRGEAVTPGNTVPCPPRTGDDLPSPVFSVPADAGPEPTFDGFLRPDGRTGTRNHYVVIPTSQCASRTAELIVQSARDKFPLTGDLAGIDSIVDLANTEGCGCAANIQIERFLRILGQHLRHPNVGGALVVDLGCEQTNYRALDAHLKRSGAPRDIPVNRLTIQEQGGTTRSVEQGLRLMAHSLPRTASFTRSERPLSELVVGTECGASDSFSGITANPLMGAVMDRVIQAGGRGILSETPEMIGAEHLLEQRMPSAATVNKFRRMMAWYRDVARRLDVTMDDNLVAENIAGGLINPCIKSLGAIAKGGTSPIVDVMDYGESLGAPGLHLMQGPGNDMESLTGMVASGATVFCFSTGRGTVTGNALVPVVKIASTSELYARMLGDMDFDAGALLRDGTLPELSARLLRLVLAVAAGRRSAAEANRQNQFQVWTAGKLSL